MKILIKNGLIVDGSGKMPYRADLAIGRDRILGIQDKYQEEPFDTVIDAEGMIITPGLIDGHTHSELSLMHNRQYPSALYQGISTVVTGQCGLGFAPVEAGRLEEAIRFNAGIFGNEYRGLKPWSSFEEFLDRLNGCSVNVSANVSHNAVRQFVTGYEDRTLMGESLERGKEILRKAMQEGAVGFSVGLSYYPGGYSTTQELIELSKVVREYDGVLCVHLRINDGRISCTPVEEVVKIVEETGVRLNMLHYRTTDAEQDISTLFAPFKELEARGQEIHYEFYPYLAGAGLLMAWLPGWIQEGGAAAVLERLENSDLRKRILLDLEKRVRYFLGEGQTARIILTEDIYSPILGKTVHEIARLRGISWSEAVVELLIENHLQVGYEGVEDQTEAVKNKLYEDQYRLFLDERYTVGSDTIPTGVLVHPRTFGAFSKVIRQMRERSVPVEFIIKKLTAYPAAIYRLKDRGMLRPGYKADVAIMDFARITDCANYTDPRNGALGVDTLLVNGLPVLRHEKITGILPGQALKRNE